MNQPSRRLDRGKREYWERRAKLLFSYPVPPPLRPADSDIALYASWVRMRASSLGGQAFNVAVLGVTRAIAAMPWPVGADILALDWSHTAARKLWPSGSAPRGSNVAIADWRELPLPDGCMDLAIGDTCYSAMSSREDSARLHEEVARVSKPGAWWIQRCFVRPEMPDRVDLLFSELESRRISAFEIFCFRLAMALQRDRDEGVRCGDVWKEWTRRVHEPAVLLQDLSWNPGSLAFIDRWKDEDARLYFPSMSDIRELVRPDFEIIETRFPDYEMGECCPMIVLQRN